LIFEQASLILGEIGENTAHIYATQNVEIATSPTDTISVKESILNGKAAVEVVVKDNEGNVKGTYVIRKVKGLSLAFPNAIAEQFDAESLKNLSTLQSIGPKKDQITISYAGIDGSSEDSKIEEAATALGIKIEKLYENEELLNVIQEHDFSTKDLLQAQVIASSFGLDLADVLNSPAIMDDIIASGGFEKYLSDLDLLDVLLGKFKEGPIGKLVETMGIQGNLEAIETLFDPEILEWMKNPTMVPPQAWLDFVKTYDKELSSLFELLPSQWGPGTDHEKDMGQISNIIFDIVERMTVLLNKSQNKYTTEPKDGMDVAGDVISFTENDSGTETGSFDIFKKGTNQLKFELWSYGS